MKKRLLTALQYALFLGLGIFLIWLSVKDFTPKEWALIKSSFKEVNYWWIALSIFIGFLSHVSRALRWQMLIQPLAHKPGFANAFMALMVGYFANLAFPRFGEIVRCGILTKYEKIPTHKLLGTVITERVIDILLLMILTLIVLVSQFKLLGSFFMDKVGNNLMDKLSGLMEAQNLLFNLSLILIAIVVLGVGYYLLRNFRETVIYRKIAGFLKGVWLGVKSVRKVKNMPLFIGHSVFIWVMYFVMIYVCFFSIKATIGLGLQVGMAVLAFGSFGFILTQGGIGAYQYFVGNLLVLYGIQFEIGYAFSWLIWAAQIGMTIVVGFGALLLLPIFNDQVQQVETPEVTAIDSVG